MGSSPAKVSGAGFIVKNICCVLLPTTTSLKMPIVKKICCVYLPASLRRHAMCYCQLYDEEDMLCVYC